MRTQIVNSLTHKTSEGLEIKEVQTEREAPERSRDFDVEGSYPVLVRELHKDAKEFNCKRYVVIGAYPETCAVGSVLWQVWRLEGDL